MRSSWHWPLAVIALLGLGVGSNVALLVVATSDRSFAVEPDYYTKALAWDRTRQQQRRSAALGWSASVVAKPLASTPGRTELIVQLHDGTGGPVSGAELRIEAFHNARAADRRHWTLFETAEPGAYRLTVPDLRVGLWELRITANRGAERFEQTLQHDMVGQ